MFTESCTPFGTDTPLTITFPLYIVPSGAVSLRSKSLTKRDSFCCAFALPATSVQARVISIPEEGSKSNWYKVENPADRVLEFSWKVDKSPPLNCGITELETEIWPQPSCALGISGVPKSTAPLIAAAFSKADDGDEIPTSSRINSRIKETDPPATAVA